MNGSTIVKPIPDITLPRTPEPGCDSTYYRWISYIESSSAIRTTSRATFQLDLSDPKYVPWIIAAVRQLYASEYSNDFYAYCPFAIIPNPFELRMLMQDFTRQKMLEWANMQTNDK